jgi:hypothetical protein
MNNLNDDELMKAAMGDFDDVKTPPQPNDPPQPHKPPVPPTPPITNKNKSKALPVAIIAIVVVVIALIAVFASKGGISASGKINVGDYINQNVELSGYDGYGTLTDRDVFDYDKFINDVLADYSQNMNEDFTDGNINVNLDKTSDLSNGDNVNVSIYVNLESLNSYGFNKKIVGDEEYNFTCTIGGLNEPVTINPFDMIDTVIVDVTDNKCYLEKNENYNENVDGFTVRYYGDDGDLQIVNSENNVVGTISYYTDLGIYNSTGKVRLTLSCEDENTYISSGVKISPIIYEADAITCNFVNDLSQISDEDFEKMKNIAIDEFTTMYPLANYECTYFGYDKAGEGNKNWGWDDGHFNQLKFAFSYVESGTTYYECVNFYDLKVSENGTICNYDEVNPETGSSVETISELEEDQNEKWQVFTKVE